MKFVKIYCQDELIKTFWFKGGIVEHVSKVK